MNCPPPSECIEREFTSVKYIVSNCNVVTMDVSGLIADVLSKTKD